LFISKHGVADEGAWLATLKDLTPKALISGVERLMALSQGDKFCDFPPNCLQFRALCLGFYSDLRLPSVTEAHREVLNRAYLGQAPWSHPAVEYTAHGLGSDFLDMPNPAEAFAKFKDAYEQVCDLVKQGHSLPAITHPVMNKKSQTPQVARRHLAAMRNLLAHA